VQEDSVPDDGVPRTGVTNVGDVANTKEPEPVSSVTAEAKLALEGVAKKVATLEPNPDTPVEIGSPVALDSVPEEGVPSTPPLTTGAPAVPILTAKAVATLEPNPDTPVEIGKPVALDSVPEEGVPSAGVVSVGEVSVLLVKVSEPAKVLKVPVVGKVTLVAPVSVRVYAKLPEPVTVIAALFDTPVPPLAGAKVPATVTAPDVAVAGVKPVEPKSIVVTPSAVLEATFTKSLPFHAQIAFSPVTIVTPEVGPVTPTSLTDCAVALITTYTLLVLGALIVNRLAGVPVQLMTMY
jgi:hypothetical protein